MTSTSSSPSGFSRFVAEMKRRHVVRFAIGYAAAAFVLLQLAEIIFPAFALGDTGLRVLVVAVALLFPPALVLAWAFDITTRGIERTPEAPDALRAALFPRLALLAITVAVAAAVGLWLVREGVLDTPAEAAGAAADDVALVAYDSEAPIRSLAVLPLDDFSGDGGQEYFTAGLQEELIAQLSQLGSLRVVSRRSVQRYAGGEVSVPRIGRDLQVDAVIEGSVRRAGNQVRITVQLIHAASDTHMWTQQYDRSLDNVLSLQSEVALDIAGQIQAAFTPEEASVLRQVATRSVPPQAQDAYLRGRFEAEKGTPEGLAAARDLLETAVEQDSSFAPALVKLAGTRVLLGLADSTRQVEEFAMALGEAERALALDSASQEAWDVVRLIREHRPGPPDTAWFQSVTQMGRQIEEQVRIHRTSAGRDTLGGRLTGARGLMAAGRFDDASVALARVVDASPELAPAWDLLARAQISSGNPRGAAATLERWAARGGPSAPTADQARAVREAVSGEGAAGYWRWMLDRLLSGRAAGTPISFTELAAARAGTGDADGAFQALDEALSRRDRGLALLQHDPVWDVLRADPRFADLTRRIRSAQVQSGPPPSRGPGAPGRP